MNWTPYLKCFKAYLLLERSLADNTIDAYERYLSKLVRFLELRELDLSPQSIETHHLESFLFWLLRGSFFLPPSGMFCLAPMMPTVLRPQRREHLHSRIGSVLCNQIMVVRDAACRSAPFAKAASNTIGRLNRSVAGGRRSGLSLAQLNQD